MDACEEAVVMAVDGEAEEGGICRKRGVGYDSFDDTCIGNGDEFLATSTADDEVLGFGIPGECLREEIP